jgi:hypothetical protein
VVGPAGAPCSRCLAPAAMGRPPGPFLLSVPCGRCLRARWLLPRSSDRSGALPSVNPPPSGFDAGSGWIARAGYCAAWGRLLRGSKAHGSRIADPAIQGGGSEGAQLALFGCPGGEARSALRSALCTSPKCRLRTIILLVIKHQKNGGTTRTNSQENANAACVSKERPRTGV